jgi:EAL domain-containing protein (putative c-di-GMP-specific phosphodiesterase class I)
MTRPARALETLRALKQMGVKLSIDDFGIGQSSLSYLKELPIDEIKIDRSFSIELDPKNLVIVRSAVAMGHDLGLTVTAEGVETQATADTLAGLGCDVAQGILFGSPAPAAELALEATPVER